MTMTFAQYAKRIEGHDWTAIMSDSLQVSQRARVDRLALEAEALTEKNKARLWKLGLDYNGPFTWWTWDTEDISDEMIKSRTGISRDEMFERGWRWAGAYLWANGVKVTEDEAKALVGKVGEREGKYSKCGVVDWKKVAALISGAQGTK